MPSAAARCPDGGLRRHAIYSEELWRTVSNETRSRFDWKLVLTLAALGLVYAALTIAGALPGVRATQWTALGLLGIIGGVAGRRAPTRPGRHGLVAGFAAGLVAIWTQALLLDTYFANNPGYADIEIPFGLPPRLATFLLGPLNAILAGLIAGFVALLSSRALGTRLEDGA